jgi:Flp pilus assembly protein TadB
VTSRIDRLTTPILAVGLLFFLVLNATEGNWVRASIAGVLLVATLVHWLVERRGRARTKVEAPAT